jgi:peptide/nickel transport system substrate-binding protein
MKAKPVWALTLVVAAALAVGCSASEEVPEEEATEAEEAWTGLDTGVNIPRLTIGGAGEISTLDYARSVDVFAGNIISLGLEGLMKIDEDGAVVPHLAESVENPDPTTYIYTLREGIRFWDGSEMTAAEVANAMNYYRNPEFETASFFQTVSDIKATGRYTVEVTLERPDPTWKFTAAFMSRVFQQKFQDEHGEKMGEPGVLIMGTGPWKFESLNPTRGVELVRNDQYWGGKPAIERISIKFLADETSMAVAFRAGEIDLALPGDARAFASTSGAELVSVPTCSAAFLSMNYKLAPWNDVHVRRAVAHTIDREGIAQALGGSVTPITQIIPQQMWAGIAPESDVDEMYESLPSYEFDLTKARQELAQSEYPNGFSATINASPGQPALGIADQVIAANLKEIGINLEVKNIPIGQYVDQFYGPRNEIPIFHFTSGCAVPDPSWYAGRRLSSESAREDGSNPADYTKPEVDELIEAGASTDDPAERLAAYGELLRIVGEDLPYVALYLNQFHLALSSEFAWPGFNEFDLRSPWALNIQPSGEG